MRDPVVGIREWNVGLKWLSAELARERLRRYIVRRLPTANTLMRKSSLILSDFPDRREFVIGEGGAVYLAERDGKFYVLKDESTFASLLSDEDLVGLELQKTFEFDSAEERDEFLRECGWWRS